MAKLCHQWVRHGFLAVAWGGFIILGAGCAHSDQTPQSKSKVAAKATTTPTASATVATTPVKAATVTSPSAEMRLQSMNVSELLSGAQTALKGDRLVAPAGDNAIEYYLKVLEKQPGNRVAQDALRETFPFAAQVADQAISQKNFPEAQREIDLLAKADPTDYTLTILRSKLDTQRKLVAQQQNAQRQATQQKLAAQQAPKKAQLSTHSPQPRVTKAVVAAVTTTVVRQKVATKVTKLATRLRQQLAAQQQLAARRAAQNHAAVLTRMISPKFPLRAARQDLQGWVTIQFTVEANGSVDNVHVIRADPPQEFDRAAIIAVRQWRFKPAVINGRPTATEHERKIRFTLSKAP